MTEQIDLRELEQRPMKYWNVDGLPELVMGLLWILWGGSFLFGERLEAGGARNVYYMVFPLILVVSGLAAGWATRKLKERITYPRSGYVKMKQPTKAARIASALLGALIAALVAALVASGKAQGTEKLAAAGVGVLLAAGFLFASVRMRAPHMLWLSGFSVLLGGYFYKRQTGWEGLNWLFVWLGAASVALGAIRLARFLRANPRTEESGQ